MYKMEERKTTTNNNEKTAIRAGDYVVKLERCVEKPFTTKEGVYLNLMFRIVDGQDYANQCLFLAICLSHPHLAAPIAAASEGEREQMPPTIRKTPPSPQRESGMTQLLHKALLFLLTKIAIVPRCRKLFPLHKPCDARTLGSYEIELLSLRQKNIQGQPRSTGCGSRSALDAY